MRPSLTTNETVIVVISKPKNPSNTRGPREERYNSKKDVRAVRIAPHQSGTKPPVNRLIAMAEPMTSCGAATVKRQRTEVYESTKPAKLVLEIPVHNTCFEQQFKQLHNVFNTPQGLLKP